MPVSLSVRFNQGKKFGKIKSNITDSSKQSNEDN